MILWCYLMVIFTDPGAVPENWRHAAEEDAMNASITRTMPNNVDTDSGNPPSPLQRSKVCLDIALVVKMANLHVAIIVLSVYTFLETVLDTLVLLPSFILFFEDGSRRSSSASDIAILFLAFVLNLAFALSLLCFIGMHISLVKSNTTSIEVYERRKSVSWKYDLGWRKNLEQIFGTNKLLWFLPLYSREDLH